MVESKDFIEVDSSESSEKKSTTPVEGITENTNITPEELSEKINTNLNLKVDNKQKSNYHRYPSKIYAVVDGTTIKGYVSNKREAEDYIRKISTNILEKYNKNYPNWNIFIDKKTNHTTIYSRYNFFMISHDCVIADLKIIKINKLRI